jgi:GntR family transcriptional repressor for pyruvate dehydrogenase complex
MPVLVWSPDMQTLDRTSLARQAAEAVKRQILTHHLQAGTRLPSERRLCEMLGISRNILREALSILVAQGIVDKVPGRGAFVGDFNRRSLDVHIRLTIEDESELGALQDLRMMLELGAMELIVQRSTLEELEQLDRLIEGLEQKLSADERINELDTQFHFALFRTAHVPALSQLYEQVLRDVTDVTVFWNPRVRDVLTPEFGMANVSLLREVVGALRRRDVYGAQQAMKKHISVPPEKE